MITALQVPPGRPARLLLHPGQPVPQIRLPQRHQEAHGGSQVFYGHFILVRALRASSLFELRGVSSIENEYGS